MSNSNLSPSARKYPEGMPHAVEMQARYLAQFGRVGATRVYKWDETGTIAAGAVAQPPAVRFRKTGLVIGVYGCALDGLFPSQAGMAAKITIGGSEELFTNGQSGQFISFLTLFGFSQNWFPVNRLVYDGNDWTVQFRNRTAGPIEPELCLAVIEAA
jgi:hypothetical protein